MRGRVREREKQIQKQTNRDRMRNWQEPSPSSRLPSVSILDPPSLHFHNVISQNCSAAAQCPHLLFLFYYFVLCVFLFYSPPFHCVAYTLTLSLFYRFNEALVTCLAYGCSPYAIKHVTDAALLLLLSTVVLFFFSLIKDRRGTHTERERESWNSSNWLLMNDG